MRKAPLLRRDPCRRSSLALRLLLLLIPGRWEHRLYKDDQPEVQGPAVWISTERGATQSPIEYSDVSAYRLSLSEDTKALNQLNSLIQEGKEMASVLYTYRSCVKALPQETSQQDMAKNRDKRKGSGLPSASHTSITLREENSGRKQNKAKGGEKGGPTNMKSMLKLQHLKSLAMWASQEASIPSLGAFFGHRLMTCGDPDPSLFPCQRCETILQPGQNCTVRIEPNRARARHGPKKSNVSTQNNVIYWCNFCSHRNVKRGTPKGHMKEICPKVKPSSVSKHTNPMPQKAANSTTVLQNEVEASKTDEIASSATAVDTPITDSPATPTLATDTPITDGPATPTLATDTPITDSPATPLVRTANTLLGGKRRKRNKPGSNKQAEPESNSASADTQKSVSTSNKRRRKSWTSLREIAETSEQGNTRNIANLTIPFFL